MPRPLRILPLGESLTADRYSYRLELRRLLAADGCDTCYMGTETSANPENHPDFDPHHAGFPGAPIREVILPWVRQHLQPESPPDLLLLWIGVNDTAWAYASYQEGQSTCGDLDALVRLILERAPRTHLFLGSIPPFDPSARRWPVQPCYVGAPERAAQYNRDMFSVAKTYQQAGYSCHFADIGCVITPHEYALRDSEHPDGHDGIHLGTTGNSRIAHAWHQALHATGVLRPCR